MVFDHAFVAGVVGKVLLRREFERHLDDGPQPGDQPQCLQPNNVDDVTNDVIITRAPTL